jgi:SAM-dependent methyltransferase
MMHLTAKSLARALLPSKIRRKLKVTANRVQFFGLKYKCPLCNSHVRVLLPSGLDFPVLDRLKVIGGRRRENAICPICHSKDRERLVYLYLVNKTDLFKRRLKLLHIAPELQIRKHLQSLPNLEYLTADLLSNKVDIKMDITSIPFPDNNFDAIISNHVLEHVVDDRRAMAELFRVLKPSGWAILQVPISPILEHTYEDFSITMPDEREIAFGQNDHVRIYAMDYVNRLREVGFDVDIYDWSRDVQSFGGAHNNYGLKEEESIYLARRP